MHSPMKLATVVVLALSGLATALPGYGETTTTTKGWTTTTTPGGYGGSTTTKKTSSTKTSTTTCSYSPTTIKSTIKTTNYETKTLATSHPVIGSTCKKADQTKTYTTTLTISTSIPKTLTETTVETSIVTKPHDITTKIPTESTSWIKTVITTSYSTIVPGYSLSTIKGNTKETEYITKTSEVVGLAPVNQFSTKTGLTTVAGSTCYSTTGYEGTTSYSTIAKPTQSVTKIVTSTQVCGSGGYGW